MKPSIRVMLSIDVAFIPNALSQQDRLSVEQRAYLLAGLSELALQYREKSLSVLGEKFAVRFSTRLNLPGLPALAVGAETETSGVQ